MQVSFAKNAMKQARLQAPRGRVAMQAVARQSWLPGSKLPAHLDGSLPGDYGFDPLNLGEDKEALKWFVQAELIHARTAMAAVAGILIPGLLTKAGALNVPEWYEAGKVYEAGKGAILEAGKVYEAGKGAIPLGSLLMVQLFMYGFVEGKRWMDMRKPGSQAEKGTFFGLESQFAGTGTPGYPGGPFDPLGFAKGGNLAELKQKEIKNGRLAMVAFLGFCAQYSATGKGPLTNLADHLADPWHKTFADNGVSVPFL